MLLVAILLCPLAADRPAPKPAPPTPLQAALTRLWRGNFDEAKAQLTPLAETDATRVTATIGLATLHRQRGELDAAQALLDAAIGKSPLTPLLAARADLHYARGRFDLASADAAAALKVNANNLLAKVVTAHILRDEGKLPEADAVYRNIVRYYTQRSNADKDITDAEELYCVAQAGIENARTHKLNKQFAFILNDVVPDMLKSNPDFWPAEVLAGSMLLEKYNRPDAVSAFEKAVAINPRAAEAHLGLAQAAFQQYDLPAAAVSLDKALSLNPKSPASLRLSADLDLLADQFPKAVEKLTLAHAERPRDAETLGRLAALTSLQKRPEEAAKWTKLAAEADRSPAPFFAAMGEAFERRRFYPEAEAAFRKATELRPEFAAATESLANLLLRTGREDEARPLLKVALAADPFNVRTANSIKVLKHLERYKTIETSHYTLKYDTSDKILAPFVAEYLEEMHAEYVKQYQYEPPGKTLVELFSSHDMFSGRTVGVPDLPTVGASSGRVVTLASPTAKGVKMPYNWGRVVRHELTHVFNLAQTDHRAPHWLTEGLAVEAERGVPMNDWRVALRDAHTLKTLFTLDTVARGFVRPKTPDESKLAYYQSSLYIQHVTKTYGPQCIGKLLGAYREGASTADAVRGACGVEVAKLEADYLQMVGELVKTFGAPAVPATAPKTVSELELAVAANADDAEASAQLAEAYLKRDMPVEARRLVDRVLTGDATNPLANRVKAQLLERGGDEEASIAVLERVRADHPNDVPTIQMLGRAYAGADDLDKAIELYETAQKLVPYDGPWLETLSRLYVASGRTKDQVRVLAEVARAQPDNLEARLTLAKAAAKAKDYPKALEYATEALRINPSSADVQDAVLDVLEVAGKKELADKLAKRFAPE